MLYVEAKKKQNEGIGKMCRVKIVREKKGLIAKEKTVYVKRADGVIEEITVSKDSVRNSTLCVGEIERSANKVLVEFPRESASGSWRVWVTRASIGA